VSATIEQTTTRPRFSFVQARRLVQDLQRPNPVIYWVDFLTSIIVGHISFHLVYFAHRIFPDSLASAITLQVVAFIVAAILYMRAVMFIHELVHLPKEGFRTFRMAWNGLCGIFFLVPSFTYLTHVDHHRRKHYGTEHDGEYLSLSHGSPWWIVGFVAQNLIIPILGYIRFAFISHICWLIPGARAWVHRHASSMVVDPFYQRPEASPELRRLILRQEFLCFLWCFWLVARAPLVKGVWFDWFWVLAYAMGVTITTINAIRTLGAHRWIGDGREMSFEDQLLDSVNYPYRGWITELWGPIGTRYHALHHLFPGLPYHNLGKAHRRLMEGLPEDSPYRETERVSLIGAIQELVHRSRHSQHRVGPLKPAGREKQKSETLSPAAG
jgi:fatty acid desaturase